MRTSDCPPSEGLWRNTQDVIGNMTGASLAGDSKTGKAVVLRTFSEPALSFSRSFIPDEPNAEGPSIRRQFDSGSIDTLEPVPGQGRGQTPTTRRDDTPPGDRMGPDTGTVAPIFQMEFLSSLCCVAQIAR